jgi:hypothetical protein
VKAILNEASQIEKYFDDNELFDDTYLYRIYYDKKTEKKEISIVVGYRYYYEGYKIGDKIGDREFMFRFKGISKYKNGIASDAKRIFAGVAYEGDGVSTKYIDANKSKNIIQTYGWHITDIVIENANNGKISIAFEANGLLEIVSEEIEVGDYKETIGKVEPWVDDDEVAFILPFSGTPYPKEWVEWLNNAGEKKVVWRIYGSKEGNIDEVTYPNYTGWFLQKKDRINKNDYGIFIEELKVGDDNFLHIKMSVKDKELDKMFAKLLRVFGKMSPVKVISGNCEFNAAQWLEYLDTGRLPEC